MVNSDLLTGSIEDNCGFLHFDESHNKIIELKKHPSSNSNFRKDSFGLCSVLSDNEVAEGTLITTIVNKICDVAVEKNEKNTYTCIRILLSLASSSKVELHGMA